MAVQLLAHVQRHLLLVERQAQELHSACSVRSMHIVHSAAGRAQVLFGKETSPAGWLTMSRQLGAPRSGGQCGKGSVGSHAELPPSGRTRGTGTAQRARRARRGAAGRAQKNGKSSAWWVNDRKGGWAPLDQEGSVGAARSDLLLAQRQARKCTAHAACTAQRGTVSAEGGVRPLSEQQAQGLRAPERTGK